MNSRVVELLEEQVSFGFTGKLNFLIKKNRQYYGHILLKNGEMIRATVGKSFGLKALCHLVFEDMKLNKFDLVLEPELVEDDQKDFFNSFEKIKLSLQDNFKLHEEALRLMPPPNIKIQIDSDFFYDTLPVTPEEFEVLKSLTEWSSPSDLYEHCPLLEHEITLALVSLRKKEALKIIALKVISG